MKKALALTLLTPLLWLGASSGQTSDGGAAPEVDEVFVDVVDVNVVNVDVHVTDKDGEKVRGLSREDFEVFEDGKPMEITNFYAVENRSVQGEAAAPGEIALEDGPVIERLPELGETPEEQQLHLIIYIDNFNIRPLNRQKALGPVRSFVRQRLREDDRIMVVSYDHAFNVRQPFTNDKEAVISTLFELEDVSGYRVIYDRERGDLLNDIYDADEVLEVSGRVRMFAESTYNELNQSLDALEHMIDTLSGLPGRKALLYVSDGIPMRAAEDMFYALNDRFDTPTDLLQAQSFDVSRRFERLVAAATSERVTIYTLDAAGLRTHSNADVTTYQAGRGSIVETVHVGNLQDPLFFMANETGGQAIVNTNNMLPMLQKVGDDFDTYYSLGYVSPQGVSGRYREIEVRVKGRKDLRVRHREGYRDKPISLRMSEATTASLHFGYQKNPLGIALELERSLRRGDGTYLVPLAIKIPMKNLVFVPRGDLQHARLRLYVTVKDALGHTAPVQEIPVPIEIRQVDFARALEHSYTLQHTLQMGDGRQLIALGLRDEIGTGTSFLLRGVNLGG